MAYDSDLIFFQKLMKNIHVQCLTITAADEDVPDFDLGFRKVIGIDFDFKNMAKNLESRIRDNKVYRFVDDFFCNYFALRLPGTQPTGVLLVGPFMTDRPKQNLMLELCERFSIPPQQIGALEKAFSFIPILMDDAILITSIHTLAESLWGDPNAFSFENIHQGIAEQYIPTSSLSIAGPEDESIYSMQAIEARYAVENELLAAVAQGKTSKAEMILAGANANMLESRNPDSLRNLKNYCIIMNTLFRKSAEQGSVHPYHIDKASSHFARKIELATSIEACAKLQKEMIRKYCLLVKNHSMKGYSLLIQKVITQIDSDLTADLSLNAMATSLGVNPSYLSSQFKKETGSTLTDYVNRRKMDHAILLLNSTPLQIQTIALHCGIPDVNYFTKLFKKYIQKTPKEYRDSITALHL